MTDPKLNGRESLKDALEAELSGTRPDFDAMLARVQRGRGEDVLEEHVDLGEPPEEIAEACNALRARVASALKVRLEQAPVPPRFSTRRTWVWTVVGVVTAAAVLFMVFDPPALFRGSRVEGTDEGGLAVDAVRLEEKQRRAREGEPASDTAARRRRSKQTEEAKHTDQGSDAAFVPPEDMPLESVVPAMEVVPQPAQVDPGGEPARNKASIDERLAELDTRAQKKWGAGDLVGARRDFRKLIKRGGRKKQVQLAYAELFALARQRGDDLSGLWREYLRKFPQGRYAPEASAGLCRTATLAKRAACWDAHTQRFPGTRGAQSEDGSRGSG